MWAICPTASPLSHPGPFLPVPKLWPAGKAHDLNIPSLTPLSLSLLPPVNYKAQATSIGPGKHSSVSCSADSLAKRIQKQMQDQPQLSQYVPL